MDGDNGTDNAPCTKAEPCTSIQKAAGTKSIIKITGTVKSRTTLSDVNAAVFANPGSKLEPSDSDSSSALEVRGDSSVEIHDLQITKPLNANANGIIASDSSTLSLNRVTIGPNGGNGIGLANNAKLTCTRCTIANNGARGIDAFGGTLTVTQSTLKDNGGGGIRATGTTAVHIIGNVVFRNGQTGKADSGGIFISVDQQPIGATPNELDFNSVSRNVALDLPLNTKANGIACTSGTDLVAYNNIVWSNGTATQVQVTNAGCSYASSNIGPNASGVISGNPNVDPLFVDEAAGDLHLKKESTMVGTAAANANLTGSAAKDIDGDMRMAPADLGADYVLPRPQPAAR